MRFSNVDRDAFDNDYDPELYGRSLYLNPGVGVRVFLDGERGLLADVEYRHDFDIDSWGDEEPGHAVHMRVVHLGYARRYVAHSKRRPELRATTLTPHASLPLGRFTNDAEDYVWSDEVGAHGAVLGVRVGADVDVHIARFFFGASLSYELLWHPGSALRMSHVVGWTVLPGMRFGIDFGERVQSVGRAPP